MKAKRRPTLSTKTHVKSRVKASLTHPYAPEVMRELLLPVTPA